MASELISHGTDGWAKCVALSREPSACWILAFAGMAREALGSSASVSS